MTDYRVINQPDRVHVRNTISESDSDSVSIRYLPPISVLFCVDGLSDRFRSSHAVDRGRGSNRPARIAAFPVRWCNVRTGVKGTKRRGRWGARRRPAVAGTRDRVGRPGGPGDPRDQRTPQPRQAPRASESRRAARWRGGRARGVYCRQQPAGCSDDAICSGFSVADPRCSDAQIATTTPDLRLESNKCNCTLFSSDVFVHSRVGCQKVGIRRHQPARFEPELP